MVFNLIHAPMEDANAVRNRYWGEVMSKLPFKDLNTTLLFDEIFSLAELTSESAISLNEQDIIKNTRLALQLEVMLIFESEQPTGESPINIDIPEVRRRELRNGNIISIREANYMDMTRPETRYISALEELDEFNIEPAKQLLLERASMQEATLGKLWRDEVEALEALHEKINEVVLEKKESEFLAKPQTIKIQNFIKAYSNIVLGLDAISTT